MGFASLIDTTGFDEQRNLLVLSLKQTTNLYLPNFSGQTIAVRSADPSVATVASETDLTSAQQKAALPPKLYEKPDPSNPMIADSRFGGVGPSPVLAWFPMSKIVVSGESVGETQLLAELPDHSAWQDPTRVVVVQNGNSRQVDRSGAAPIELQREFQKMRLREAAVSVAQDQIHSALTRQGSGDLRYDLPDWAPPPQDWCGAFVYWCYRKAAEIKGHTNPLGRMNDVMLSPEKAIGWALANPAQASLLRYKGPALFQWGKSAPASQDVLVDVLPGTNLLPGDVCLLRKEGGSGWQHVCMVYDPGSGDSFVTLDGNQGSPSMKMVLRDMNARLTNGSYVYVFVHLNIP